MENKKLSKEQLAEANSRPELLISFKVAYGQSQKERFLSLV